MIKYTYIEKIINDMTTFSSNFPIIFLPCVFNHGYKGFIKQYICGVFLFYSTTISTHRNMIKHPITHIYHNINVHSKLNKNLYLTYFKKFDIFNDFFLIRLNIINEIYKLNEENLYFLIFQIFHEGLISKIIKKINEKNKILNNNKYKEILESITNKNSVMKLRNLLNIDFTIGHEYIGCNDLTIIIYVLKEYLNLYSIDEINQYGITKFKIENFYNELNKIFDIFKNLGIFNKLNISLFTNK